VKGLPREQSDKPWAEQVLTECAVVSVGSSERGIGLQVVVLSLDGEEFDGATVYMDRDEARKLMVDLAKQMDPPPRMIWAY